MRAMILAAGLGTRMRPLTSRTPKALLLINEAPLISYPIKLLKKYGFDEIMINTHHLSEKIQNELGDGGKWGVKITYSFEPKILGTGGGIQKALQFFGKAPFIVINTDILIDIDLKKLMESHKERGGIATLVVRKRREGYTPIHIHPENWGHVTKYMSPISGNIISIGEKGNWMYTGLQVIDPKLFKYLTKSPPSCIVRDGYMPALANGEKIFSYHHDGYWTDIGTLELYRQAESDVKSGSLQI